MIKRLLAGSYFVVGALFNLGPAHVMWGVRIFVRI